MRHMLKPLDFSVEETAELLALAGRIEKIAPRMQR